MKFRVYEHDDGFFAIDIPDLELAWNYLDAGDVLDLIRGLGANSSEFVLAKSDYYEDKIRYPEFVQLASDYVLVCNDAGLAPELSPNALHLLDMIYHTHLGDMEIYGKC